jgi:oligopeptidase A
MTNPLIENKGIVNYPAVRSVHVEPAVHYLKEQFETTLATIENNTETPTWENVVLALEAIDGVNLRIWAPVQHLISVRTDDEMRAAYEKCQPEIVSLSLKMGQSQKLYKKLKMLKNGAEWDQYSDAQKRTIDGLLLNQELSGIVLTGDKQVRFNEIATELSSLSTKFSNNVLDAVKKWELVLTEKEELDGLPDSAMAQFSQAYNETKKEETTPENGPWLLTLAAPSYIAFMNNAKNRELREKVYKAFCQKASSGDLDNTNNILRILELRQEKADLLGFANFAEVSLAQKMADNVDEIYDLFESMREASLDHAKKEFEEISAIAKSSGQNEKLRAWDMQYWSKRLEEDKYAYTESELRPYFPLANVLEGLFGLVNKIFGVTVEAADGDAPVWDKDVRFFNIKDSNGEHIASFFLDPYSRPENKRGGAWMNVCVDRRVSEKGDVQIPVAYLICNGTTPVGDTPSLMTFREVETLFHEFGHGLQHMLTKVNVASVAGIAGVEWDAVELPSQFMENWCYHKNTLLGLAKHYQTGETLPEELFNKIKAAKNFRTGHQILRQASFAYVDLKLHTDFDSSKESVFELFDKVSENLSYMESEPEGSKFLCSFSHIFAGGYSAGYYSYMWAHVLSADAFEAFEEAGLDDAAAVEKIGARFRDTVLGLGGSKHPGEVFSDFRGRGPKTDAFMRHNGLTSR